MLLAADPAEEVADRALEVEDEEDREDEEEIGAEARLLDDGVYRR